MLPLISATATTTIATAHRMKISTSTPMSTIAEAAIPPAATPTASLLVTAEVANSPLARVDTETVTATM